MLFETATFLISNIIDTIKKYSISSFDDDFMRDNHVGFWVKNSQGVQYRCVALFINDKVSTIIRAKNKTTKSMSWQLNGVPVNGCIVIWSNPDIIIKEKIAPVKSK